MSKEIVITVIILVAIIGLNAFVGKYVDDKLNYVLSELNDLRPLVEEEKYEEANQKINEIDEYWKKSEDIVSFFVEHDELEKVMTEYTSLKTYCKLEQEEALRQEKIKAEKANNAKSIFLFNMLHDIRTSMNAILGYSQLMKKELTNPKLVHYQEMIEQSSQLLLSIINNVLDMARVESGKMELDENYEVVGNIT